MNSVLEFSCLKSDFNDEHSTSGKFSRSLIIGRVSLPAFKSEPKVFPKAKLFPKVSIKSSYI